MHRQRGRSHPQGRGQPQPLGGPRQPGKVALLGEVLCKLSPGQEGRGGPAVQGQVPGQGLPLTKNSWAKHRPNTSASTQATSPKDTPRAAILESRKP